MDIYFFNFYEELGFINYGGVYMKFWTIQNKSVIETIQKKGIYQPDFNSSRYLEINQKLNDLYSVILQSFNRINKKNLPGIVYAFAKSDNNRIYSIETIEEFEKFIKIKQAVIDGFWKQLDKDNSEIIELEYEDSFNPIFIDINDFQFLMPPIMLLPPYTEESINRILNDIKKGQITASEFQSNVIQAHLPYIEKKNVVNTYPVFALD